MSEIFWAATWSCPDCGHQEPIEPGANTRPIADAHECDAFKLATTQAERAGFEAGYRFALENLDDPLVRADRAEHGTGWYAIIRNGGFVIEVDAEEPE